VSPLGREEAHAFIARHRLGVVCSNAENRAPESAVVGIAVSPSLEIFFDTTGDTRKAKNLRRDPRISVVVGWDDEQTMQLEGVADEPKGAELDALKTIYFAAWPDGPSREHWPGITWFRVRPTWIRLSDYNRIDDVVRDLRL
jgi:general stress protein 26